MAHRRAKNSRIFIPWTLMKLQECLSHGLYEEEKEADRHWQHILMYIEKGSTSLLFGSASCSVNVASQIDIYWHDHNLNPELLSFFSQNGQK